MKEISIFAKMNKGAEVLESITSVPLPLIFRKLLLFRIRQRMWDT
jgi:hypothetical protein